MMQRSSRQVITAGKADETVADGGGPTGNNSIFTGHLLEGMSGAASTESGVITASGLMSYTYRKVSSDSRSNQTPHFGHIDGDGDFILRTPEDVLLKPGPTVDFLVKAVAERPEAPAIIDPAIPVLGFAEKRGYADPDAPTFGRNEWTKKLGQSGWNGGAVKQESAFVRYTVNLIGTSDTILADFAGGDGKDNKKWRDPFTRDPFGYGSFSNWKCHDSNLQFQFKLVIGSLGEREAFAIIHDCAERLGLAYNHQSAPRCFNFETDDFPWRQFEARGD